MSSPIVSIVVPNYNHARFLRERLQSILAQTFQDFEIILLDDASSDDSVAILQQFAADPKVSCFVANEVNSGNPCAQWLKGVGLARGRYVWLAESDDAAEPEFLDTVVARLEADAASVVAYTNSRWIDEHGARVPDEVRWLDSLDPARWHGDFTAVGAAEVRDYLAFRNTIPNASAAVFRTSAARRIEWPLDFLYSGDWVFWTRLLALGTVHYCSRELNRFRFHGTATRAVVPPERSRKRCVEYLRAIESVHGSFRWYPHAGNRDHTWVTKAWLAQNPVVPWFAVGESSVRPAVRASFLLSAFMLGGPMVLAPGIGLGRWCRRLGRRLAGAPSR